MRNNNLIRAFLVIALSLFTYLTAYAASDPSAMLQNVANNMIAGLRENKATLRTKPQVVYNLAYKYVVPHADLDQMSRRVLPPQVWNSATPAQRQQFKKLFTQTLIRTYASGLSSYQDQTVKVYPARGASGNIVQVDSQIQSSDSQPIRVTYLLMQSGGSWRLVDMSVEGVSMLESFRSQFADILSSGDMNTLLQRLSSHNNARNG